MSAFISSALSWCSLKNTIVFLYLVILTAESAAAASETPLLCNMAYPQAVDGSTMDAEPIVSTSTRIIAIGTLHLFICSPDV